ncbi:tol-pal system protein YbgF [Aquimixticola soesokkakensis]|uniref:Cell division coordinator CpoB n=1 Tax=Aquimixticola soesokkakensis TaxID=1519096 RepID=A0A1Y5S5G9_9RHOB|nr:tol-pal system protein YbgF [Aquimixticola soesokkakensis]SLN32738.1 tol-pal system protein YbgF [Aquimixticola soesokkakensis]
MTFRFLTALTLPRAVAGAAFAASLALCLPAQAQDSATLADIRAEASTLAAQIVALRQEMNGSGATQSANFAQAGVLEKVDLIEARLTQLTNQLEELQFRVNRVVEDGTNQLDDLNFRICELEAGCDIGNLPPLAPLGGGSGTSATPTSVAPATPSGGDMPQLAINEQSDFDAAKSMLDGGAYEGALSAFATFTETYPGGPLTPAAMYYRGEALLATGRASDAARAYLEAYSTAPEGNMAPDALLRVGTTLASLGQTDKACVMLGEVMSRYAGSQAASDATFSRQSLGCS